MTEVMTDAQSPLFFINYIAIFVMGCFCDKYFDVSGVTILCDRTGET